MNLLHLFDLSLIARRDEIALEWEGAEFTFGEIENRSNRLAHALRARGLAKGDRLAVYLANRVELIDLYLACIKLGVIFVPINILYRDREIAHITGDAEPKFVIREDDLPALTSEAENASSERPNEDLDGDTPAAIIYTSGTTGASKGAVLTHNNFAANAVNLLTMWQISDRDRFLLALPLFHVHALGNGLHCWLASGCRMRLLERFDHRTALDEFNEFQPTLFFGVPTIYVRLLDTPPDAAREIGAQMRLFVSGSAPLPANVFERFRELFGHAILERYGMTETFMTLSNPYIGERRAGTVGFPLPGISVRIEDGELLVRGPNIFAGYWRCRRCHNRRVYRRLVPHRRSGIALGRRLLHAPRPQVRSHHLRRLQHLSARDRRAAAGTTRRFRSRGGRRAGRTAWRSAGRVHRGERFVRRIGFGTLLPRATGVVQGAAQIRARRFDSPNRARQSTETSSAAIKTA